mgnify:CR=1 FL=1
MAAGGTGQSALYRQHRRQDAARHARSAARRVTENVAVSDVRTDRILPLHLFATRGTRSPPRLDRQGNSQRRSAGRARSGVPEGLDHRNHHREDGQHQSCPCDQRLAVGARRHQRRNRAAPQLPPPTDLHREGHRWARESPSAGAPRRGDRLRNGHSGGESTARARYALRGYGSFQAMSNSPLQRVQRKLLGRPSSADRPRQPGQTA